MSFFWFQRTGGEEAWREATSDHRSKILAEIRPAFVTVLNASVVPETGWSREQYDEVKYSGPFYIDWDAESIEEAISSFHQTLAKLQEMDVDLDMVRLYATGGRGFHLEVPEPMFMPKVPKAGVNHLPGIYREMAMELFVENMDMRVYTGRRGRMWRVPNVQRENGKYKVPLTTAEALAMTPELYEQLCSEPRMEPNRADPLPNIGLTALYVKSADKVARGVKNRVKTAKDVELLAHFKGDFPASLKRVMAGEGLAPGVGFNRIAMQLAITANALGKSADDLIKACEGLIKNHQSDGRYNSPRKRKQALRDLWYYTNESDAYSYSRGGIRSVVAPDFPTGDLDGPSNTRGLGHVPESIEEDEDDGLTDEAREEIHNAANSILEGITILRSGVYKRTADGPRLLSNISFVKPAVTVDAADGLTLGIEADVVTDGSPSGRHLISARTFQSKANLNAFCSGRGGIFSGSDNQASVVGLLLQRSAKKGGRMIYIVRREGLDLIQNPLDRSKVDLDTIWVGSDRVLSYREGMNYRFSPQVGDTSVFNSDLHCVKAPLTDTEDTRRVFQALFNMNSPQVVAQMLGWFVSCFHKQFYQRAFDQFPLLHPNGPAGSGKTMSTALLGRLFHNTTKPKIMSASAGTLLPLKHAWSSSASIPLIIDEYKPTEMRPDRLSFLLTTFRDAYNQAATATGGVNRGGAESSFRDITEYEFSAPTVFLGETQETQTAVLQRSVTVAINPMDSRAHTRQFEIAKAGANVLPQLGRLLLAMTMGSRDGRGEWILQPETIESRAQALIPLQRRLRESMHSSVHDRQVYNLAVVLAGLEFLDEALQQVFGDHFRGQMETLMGTLFEQRAELQVSVMSEAAKVLNDMSLISRTEEYDSEFALREGVDYLITDQGVEILLREAFVKYFAWCKRKGFVPLYLTPESFIAAMGKFPAVVDRLCLASPLRKSAQARIFRFNLDGLAAEGVEGFKSDLMN